MILNTDVYQICFIKYKKNKNSVLYNHQYKQILTKTFQLALTFFKIYTKIIINSYKFNYNFNTMERVNINELLSECHKEKINKSI